MAREIQGIVQRNPVILDKCCIFAVEQKEGSYLVLSTESQADKDSIFVEQGQEISIKGSIFEDKSFKGVLLTEQAKIKIHREGRTRE